VEVSEYPARIKHLAAVRFYLRSMIWRCENALWTRAAGITNHRTLLDRIERWRPHRYGSVTLMTFNYDTLIERALPAVGVTIQGLDDCIANETYQLYKLHGSVTWGRPVVGRISGASSLGEDDDTISRRLIDNAQSLELTDRYEYLPSPTRVRVGQPPMLAFPAIAVPFETKLSFECPATHLRALESRLERTTHLLIVGWRAMEEHFLLMLRRCLKTTPMVLIVAGTDEAGKEVQEHLVQAHIPGTFGVIPGGFSDLISKGLVDQMLGMPR
jgi:hypothetical protein